MKVTVHFIGICTHINDVPDLTRVVLINAGFGMNIAQNAISPHTAKLHIPIRFIASAPPATGGLTPVSSDARMTWTMNGVQLQLGNATGGLIKSADYVLPSLSRTAGVPSLALSQRVVGDGAAACEFRISAGTLEAYQLPLSTAIIAKLMIE